MLSTKGLKIPTQTEKVNTECARGKRVEGRRERISRIREHLAAAKEWDGIGDRIA
jgi:hypothetical protein